MTEKSEERKDIQTEDHNTENKDLFKTQEDSCILISKMWEDSYLKPYIPWSGSRGSLFETEIELSKDTTPQKYREFYEEWIRTCQNTCSNFYEICEVESGKEAFEKLLVIAEDSNKIYRSWIDDLEENSRATRDVLKGEPDPSKYNDIYEMWIKSYGRIFDELLTLPFRQNIKEIFEKLTGAPDIYSNKFETIAKLWNDSYMKRYRLWINSMIKLFAKSSEISRGNASPETYKEFNSLWQNTSQETYGKMFDLQPMLHSKEAFENFARNASVDLNLSKYWIAILEKLSQKVKELSKQNADLETYMEFYNLWAKTYEKALKNLFESIPPLSPFKDIFEPVKNAAMIYADSFTSISSNRMKTDPISVDAV